MSQENRPAIRRARYGAVFIGLIVAFAALVVWNINSGSVNISVGDIARIIFLREGRLSDVNIVWKLRLPRIIAAAVPINENFYV